MNQRRGLPREGGFDDLDRHLAAVWFADIVGYTRLSEEDERSAWRLISAFQEVVREVVKSYGGRLVKFTGDGALAEFPSTELAVRSGHALIGRFVTAALEAGVGERTLRVGVHVGDVGRTPDGDLIGDGVNVAARIQTEALPAQVWVSEDVRRQLRQHPELQFEARGAREVKGLSQPLSLHAVVVTDEAVWVRPLHRGDGRTRLIVAGVSILGLSLVAAWFTQSRQDSSELGMDNPGRVAVVPFENRTGDPTLDPVGQIAADWIGEFIVRTGFVEVVDFNAAMAMRSSTEQSEAELANATEAGTLVTGSFYKQGDSLAFQARILRGDGRLIAVLPQVSGASRDPIEVIDRLRERVVTALAVHFDRRLPSFEGLGGDPPSFAAYEKYVSGLKYYLQGDYENAANDLQQAIEIDSTFARARVWLLPARAFNDLESVDSLASEIHRRESALSLYDRHHARFFTAFLKEDLERAYDEARAMLEASPGSRDALRETALSAIRVGRPDEGVRLLHQLSHDRVLLRNWPQYWLYLALAHLQLGNPESALGAAREGQSQHPDSPDPVTAQALALIDLGRVSEAVEVVEPFFQVGRGQVWISTSLLAVGLRARARGHKEVADALFERTIFWMETVGDGEVEGVYLSTLLATDRLQEAMALVERELAAGHRSAAVLGTYGIVKARQQDVQAANSVLGELAGPEGTGNRIWRARILAVLGEEQEAIRVLGRIQVDPWGVEMPVAVWPEFADMRGDPGFPGLPHRNNDP